MTTRSKGFTIVELIVVVALFGFLAVVAANFLIAILSSNNRVTTENEVRQNASLIMEDIGGEVRHAGQSYYCQSSNTAYLWLSPSSFLCDSINPCSASTCQGANVLYTSDKIVNAGVMTAVVKKIVSGTSSQISSNKVLVLDCGLASACSNSTSGCTPGLVVSPVGLGTGSVDVSLSVRQLQPTTRQDSCSKLSLQDTFTMRNSGN